MPPPSLLAPAYTSPPPPSSCLDQRRGGRGCSQCRGSTCASVPMPPRTLPAPAHTSPPPPSSCLDVSIGRQNHGTPMQIHDCCTLPQKSLEGIGSHGLTNVVA